MPRRLRIDRGGIAYHVLNWRAGRLPLFEKHGDYVAFEQVLDEAYAKTPMRVICHCLMPNHWHLEGQRGSGLLIDELLASW